MNNQIVNNQIKTKKRQHILNHLKKIINTQSRLAEASFDLDRFKNLVVEQVAQLTKAVGVVVELVEGDEMIYRAATGTVKSHLGLHLAIQSSISGLCVIKKEILRSADTDTDLRVNKKPCRLVHARSLIVAPLFHEGNAVGVLKILSDKPNGFNEEDVTTLQLMAGLIGSALQHQILHQQTEQLLKEKIQALNELIKAEKQLKHMAQYDFLTNIF